ncbi:MAG TPA: bifunctional diaminohydroxyphosphoribosylaminopyrimidine deaminase/5-amino-6-(5-phosphoribosylamino)uracil reductase RibD [Bacteroidales bacterium]|nr:bifunctional diaminohydroxyphosphoribosylaminopyrimidine deaminase/5-amino-6-(5-phosphoribosylamino)uracil reductase RibD [Bacteroidales bacterium]
MNRDEQFMNRCLDLAAKGLGSVAPNPLVGSVVVCHDNIIGEGFHRVFGGPHAEVYAINSVQNRLLIPESTLYVNLEPCSHFGKTPPCSDLIIQNGIKRVVVGSIDSHSVVAGKGIARLRNHGCEVTVGVLKNSCLHINRRFFTFHGKKRPYIVLKWAQTADGYIDAPREFPYEKPPARISSERFRLWVHKWRSEESAIMVGTNTALADNPKLSVRDWTGTNPLRIVIDRHLELPKSLQVFDNSQDTLVINEKIDKTENRVTYCSIPFAGGQMNLHHLCSLLHSLNIQSVLVEGGRQLLQTFIDEGLWDEARVMVGQQFFGQGVKSPVGISGIPEKVICGDETFYCFFN